MPGGFDFPSGWLRYHPGNIESCEWHRREIKKENIFLGRTEKRTKKDKVYGTQIHIADAEEAGGTVFFGAAGFRGT